MDIMNMKSSIRKKYEEINARINHKNNTTELMNNLFKRITDLTKVLNENLNKLLELSANLPDTKSDFLDILEKTKQALMACMNDNEDDVKKISEERKRLEESIAHIDSSSLLELKQSILNAMHSNEWEAYKKYLFCCPPTGLWAYVLQIVVIENAQQFCDYLLKALPTINHNILIIYEILEDIGSNKLLIQLRIEQIKKNWSVISENIDLAIKQPHFFEGCSIFSEC